MIDRPRYRPRDVPRAAGCARIGAGALAGELMPDAITPSFPEIGTRSGPLLHHQWTDLAAGTWDRRHPCRPPLAGGPRNATVVSCGTGRNLESITPADGSRPVYFKW